MKNKLLSLQITVILIIMLISLTGCGSSSTSMKDDLNNLMNELEKTTEDFHVSTVQEYLEKNSNYRLIDGMNKEFTEKPSDSESKFTSIQKSEQLVNVATYVVIYNIKDNKYYTMPIGAVGYKPYFNEETELK